MLSIMSGQGTTPFPDSRRTVPQCSVSTTHLPMKSEKGTALHHQKSLLWKINPALYVHIRGIRLFTNVVVEEWF
jgi:hypothetical protein